MGPESHLRIRHPNHWCFTQRHRRPKARYINNPSLFRPMLLLLPHHHTSRRPRNLFPPSLNLLTSFSSLRLKSLPRGYLGHMWNDVGQEYRNQWGTRRAWISQMQRREFLVTEASWFFHWVQIHHGNINHDSQFLEIGTMNQCDQQAFNVNFDRCPSDSQWVFLVRAKEPSPVVEVEGTLVDIYELGKRK